MKLSTILLNGALAVVILLNSAAAQEVMSTHLNPRADGIIGADDRHPLDWGKTASLGTTSVGRQRGLSTKLIVRLLDLRKDFVCTGAVVGPTTILTAAHCAYWKGNLLDRRHGRAMLAETWNGEQFEIENWVVHDRYEGNPLPQNPLSTSTDQYSVDVALLYTSRTISSTVGGFLGITKRGDRLHRNVVVHLVGFHQDVDALRPKMLVAETCVGDIEYLSSWSIFHRKYKELGRIVHDCDSSSGSSGAALLTVEGHHIFGVHVAGGNGEDALGVHLGAKKNNDFYNQLYKRVRENREKYGYRMRRPALTPEGYLTNSFQGPDDVLWLK